MSSIPISGHDVAHAEAATPDQPVSAADRLVSLDFIRGIAVCGILFANITAFGHPMLAYFWPDGLPGGSTPMDSAVWLFQFVFVDGKFRGLFSVLFGAGMMLFIGRVWARGGSRWLQARRLLWLGLFGLAHFFLIWTGDILFLYAVSGLVGLLFLKWKPKTQLRVGIVTFILGSLLLTVMMGSQAAVQHVDAVRAQMPAEALAQADEAPAKMIREAKVEGAVMAGDSWPAIVRYRIKDEADSLLQNFMFAPLETIPLMLIGMGLYGVGFFEGRLDRRKMIRWGWIGFVGGALLSVPLGYVAIANDFPMFLTLFVFNGPVQFLHLAMILGMAALFTVWAPAASRGWLGSRFVATGRMAFSNYLGTSMVMALIFQGWAGGLYGQLHRIELMAVAAFGWALMLAWSKPWLARYRYGPLEWLWRCLTYWKLFPMKRTQGVAAPT